MFTEAVWKTEMVARDSFADRSAKVARCGPGNVAPTQKMRDERRPDCYSPFHPTRQRKGTPSPMHSDHTPTVPAQKRDQLLIDRAWRAYLSKARRNGETLRAYSKATSFVSGEFVILRSFSGTLAVFQLVNRALRRLDSIDWPEEYR